MGIREIKQKKITEPRTTLLFSLPKVGKTRAALEGLPNSLVLDFDNSCGYYEGVYINFKGENIAELYTDFINKMKELKEDVAQNGKFEYIVIDTITEFHDSLAAAMAITMYNNDPNTKTKLSFA